jgi:hypothetical protein
MLDVLQKQKNDRHWLTLTGLTALLFVIWLTAKGWQWDGYPCFAWPVSLPIRLTYMAALLGAVIYFCQLLVFVVINPERFYRKTIFLAFISYILLRIILGSALPLLGDEAYHWIWPQQLDWCYYDHGGLTAWVCYPFWLMGKAVFYARLAPILLGTLTAVLVWRFTRSLTGDKKIANIALAGLMMLPVGLIGTLILFTDTPLAPIWIAGLWTTILALRTGKLRWWILLGLLMGLGLNCKFLIFGLMIMIFCYLLIDPRGRRSFKTPGPYLAVIIAMIMFIPLVYWNATHDWLTFVFNFGKRGDALGFNPKGLIGFSVEQILLVGPIFLIWCFYYPARWGWRKFREGKIEPLILVLGGYIPFMTYAVLKLMRPLNSSVINWTAPLFAVLTIILAWSAIESTRNKKWCRLALHAGAVMTCIFVGGLIGEFFIGPDPIRQIGKPIVKEKNLNRYLADFFGWQPLGRELDQLLPQLNPDRLPFIMTRTYMHAAQLTQYCSAVPLVLSMHDDFMYGRCFDYWNQPQTHLGQDCVFVATHPISEGIRKELEASFASVRELPLAERNPQAWVNTVFHLYYCERMKKLPSAADAKKK